MVYKDKEYILMQTTCHSKCWKRLGNCSCQKGWCIVKESNVQGQGQAERG